MTPVLTILDDRIDSTFLHRVAKQLHAERESTRQALIAGIPLVIGVIAHNAVSSDEHAQQLYEALEKDHPGGLLEDLPRELRSKGGLKGALFGSIGTLTGGGQGRAIAGVEIIKHIMADRQEAVTKGISNATGLSSDKTKKLLEFLGPVVMSAIGQVRHDQDLDAEGVRVLLVREREMIEEAVDDVGDEALWKFLRYDSLKQVATHVEETAGALVNAPMLSGLFMD